MKLLSLVKPYNAKSDEGPGSGWFDQDAYAGHVSYPQNPVRSAAELMGLLNELNAALPKVSVPVLLIHSKDDAYISPENMPRIYARLGTRDKEMLWVTGSGHVVTRDAAREQVFAAASAFIQRVSAREDSAQSV
jgi:carboxylesterase